MRVQKRAVDILASFSALVVLMPFLLFLAFLIRIKLGSPVIFSQERPGLHGRIFRMYKFRSMTDARDGNGDLLPDEERLTTFGKRLRNTSLDELPELWNVLKGDMSLVGPRPLLVEYLPLYSADQMRRHEVRPGITGWAQVNGRNAISWEDKFALDVWYVDHWSPGLDLRILRMTFRKVFLREGVSAEGHVTTTRFKGSQE